MLGGGGGEGSYLRSWELMTKIFGNNVSSELFLEKSGVLFRNSRSEVKGNKEDTSNLTFQIWAFILVLCLQGDLLSLLCDVFLETHLLGDTSCTPTTVGHYGGLCQSGWTLLLPSSLPLPGLAAHRRGCLAPSRSDCCVLFDAGPILRFSIIYVYQCWLCSWKQNQIKRG